MANDTCSVVEDGKQCETKVYARKMCRLHYDRWIRLGTPLLERRAPRGCSVEGCEKPHYGNGFCDTHNKRWKLYGDPAAPRKARVKVSAVERFWSKVDKTGPIPEQRPDLGPCWLWTAALFDSGYATFQPQHGHAVRAHRWIYQETVGSIPDGLVLDHLCRVRHCVNPSHLEPVTVGENVRRGALVVRELRRPGVHRLPGPAS